MGDDHRIKEKNSQKFPLIRESRPMQAKKGRPINLGGGQKSKKLYGMIKGL